VTCAFSPMTITPGSSASSSTLTLTAAASAPAGGYFVPGMTAWLPFSGVGMLGMVFAVRQRTLSGARRKWQRGIWIATLGVLILGVLFTVGCGSSSSKTSSINNVTVMVTGTSGAISHTTPVALTIQ
jgi:hypothetical protein